MRKDGCGATPCKSKQIQEDQGFKTSQGYQVQDQSEYKRSYLKTEIMWCFGHVKPKF